MVEGKGFDAKGAKLAKFRYGPARAARVCAGGVRKTWRGRYVGLAVRRWGRENLGMKLASDGVSSGAAAREHGTLREYMTHLRVEKGLRPLSCEAYLRDLEMFAEFLESGGGDGAGVKTFLSAEQDDVSGFMQHLREHGVQSRSIARKLSCVRGFYKWLLMEKRVKRDPTVNIESPSSWKVLPKSLAESEVREMLGKTGAAARAADASGAALRDHAMLELLYAGGLRVGRLSRCGRRICGWRRLACRFEARAIRRGLCQSGGARWRRWKLM